MKIKINKLYRLINEIGLFETISLLYLKMFNKKKYDLKILEKIKNENLKILKYYSEQENKISDVIQNTDYIWFFNYSSRSDFFPVYRSFFYQLY